MIAELQVAQLSSFMNNLGPFSAVIDKIRNMIRIIENKCS